MRQREGKGLRPVAPAENRDDFLGKGLRPSKSGYLEHFLGKILKKRGRGELSNIKIIMPLVTGRLAGTLWPSALLGRVASDLVPGWARGALNNLSPFLSHFSSPGWPGQKLQNQKYLIASDSKIFVILNANKGKNISFGRACTMPFSNDFWTPLRLGWLYRFEDLKKFSSYMHFWPIFRA